MKIIYEDAKEVAFGLLNDGEVFLHNNEDVCIKIEKIIGNDGYTYNAVYIDTGNVLFVDCGKMVKLVDYEFKVIKK